MQARMRRSRVAILVSTALCFTSTCGVQGDSAAAQRSGAADTAYAASSEIHANAVDEQAITGPVLPEGSLSEDSADASQYNNDSQWKADLYDYDDSLSLTSYEAANTEPDDPLTMTTAAIIDLTFDDSVTTTITTIQEPTITATTTIVAQPDSVVFYSSGFGHGVGMSQNGANFYAMYDGWTYDQILAFYYPGTQLVQTGTPESELLTVNGKTDTVVSIISQIVNNEMGPSFSVEALKAQAVAAYTFYVYNGSASGLICKPNPSQKIVDAVRSVLGVQVYYNGAPALTMFSASSGGATASCKDIFFVDLPYLISIPVKHDDTADPHYNSYKVFSASELKNKLQKAYGVTLTGSPYDWIQLEYGDGGYVSYAVIGGAVRVKGNDLRGVLGLKSPKFEFVYQSGTEAGAANIATTEAASYSDPSATHADVITKYTTTTTANSATTDDTTDTAATSNSTDSSTGSSELSTVTSSETAASSTTSSSIAETDTTADQTVSAESEIE